MGGVSTSAFARPRITDDDVFVRPDQARPTLRALEAAGFETEEHDERWLFKAFEHGVLIDVIFRSSGDVYVDDGMMARAAGPSKRSCASSWTAGLPRRLRAGLAGQGRGGDVIRGGPYDVGVSRSMRR